MHDGNPMGNACRVVSRRILSSCFVIKSVKTMFDRTSPKYHGKDKPQPAGISIDIRRLFFS